MLHCLGFDHEQLTYRYAGRDFRLTDVHGEVIQRDPVVSDGVCCHTSPVPHGSCGTGQSHHFALRRLFQASDKLLQIPGQGHREFQLLAGTGMHETQVGGVQGQARRAAVVDDRRFCEWTTILDVAADRMTQFRQMNANLIRATGLQLTLQFGVVCRSCGAE